MYQWNADKIVLPFFFFNLKWPLDNLPKAAKSVLCLDVSVISHM